MTDHYDPTGGVARGDQPGGENQGQGGSQGGYPLGDAGGVGNVGNIGNMSTYTGQDYTQSTTPQPYPESLSQAYELPTVPSEPYTLPATPPQPYQGRPSQPYAGQFGQQQVAPPPFYNEQTVFTQPPVPATKSRWLMRLLIVAGVILVLGSIGVGGAVYFINQYKAPGMAALQFCNQLKEQKYDAAYGMLSSGLAAKYSSTDFRAGVTALDTAEGKVVGCQQATGSSTYQYSLGASAATVTAQISRAIQGNLTGSLHLKNQKGSWKIDGIDASLLGASIGALQTSGAFCSAMQSQDYATAYTLLDSAQQKLISKDDFVASGKLHDQIDGAVTKCALAKVPQGNTNQVTRLTINLSRATLGDRAGDVTLKLEGSAWKIDATDTALNGTDLRPLVVGLQYCALISAGKYSDAYGLVSSGYRKLVTQDQFVANYSSYFGATLKWTCGTPEFKTYTVANTTASVVVPMTTAIPALGDAAATTNRFEMLFVLENNAWKIEDIVIPR